MKRLAAEVASIWQVLVALTQEVAELRRDGLPAFTVDQRSRHTEADPDECAACRADIKQSINPLPTFERTKRTT